MCVDTAGSIPRAAFYSGSSIGRAMVSKTVGCRFKACPERHAMYSRGTAVQSIAGHLAAKVPDAAAPIENNDIGVMYEAVFKSDSKEKLERLQKIWEDMQNEGQDADRGNLGEKTGNEQRSSDGEKQD